MKTDMTRTDGQLTESLGCTHLQRPSTMATAINPALTKEVRLADQIMIHITELLVSAFVFQIYFFAHHIRSWGHIVFALSLCLFVNDFNIISYLLNFFTTT